MNQERTTPPAKFGDLLGVGPGGVPVYSSDYDTVDKIAMPTRRDFRSYVDGLFMGYKWQCVELARRWLYLNKGYVFDDIAMAYDIFNLRSVRVVEDGALLPLRSFRNGSKRRPEPGCLLIWDEGGEFDVTGHVAVVTEVFDDCIRCLEQNVDNGKWPEGRDFSRELAASVSADGGYRISCTYPESRILGWVIQTDDDTHAETVADADPDLLNLVPRRVESPPASDDAWLDPAHPDEAAYIAMMKSCKLSSRDTDRHRYFVMSETAARELKHATNELHNMFLHATNHVLQDDALLRRFNLPPALWPRIHQSWDNRRNRMITGRFDFSMSDRGIKAYEYNADSASCHMECGKIQTRWAAHYGCDVGRCAGDGLTESLISAWKRSRVDGVLHIMRDNDLEETYHALYMKTAIEKAGIDCKIITGLSGLRWDDDGCVTDADGVRINWVWKTWAWETAIDQIRAECSDDDEDLRLHRNRDRRRSPPRLVDVLLRPEVMVFEPLWTLIASNKAILPILCELYPGHPNLLDTRYDLTPEMAENGHVVKPIVGRCGSNIEIVDGENGLVEATAGQFDDRDRIYQELFPLAWIDGDNVQVSTFTVGGKYAGSCVRVDPSPIITTHSDLLALRIVDDGGLTP